MKANTLILGGLALTSPLLIALVPTATKVTFAPAEGVSLTKTFVLEQSFALDDMNMSMNGEEMPMEMEMEMEVTQSTSVTDTYDKMAEGKPAKMTRLYKDGTMALKVDAQMSVMGQDQDQSDSGEGGTQLKDAKVIFTWNEEEGAYVKKFHEDTEGEEEWLDGLVEDMDLRGMLPDKEVEVGDTWSAKNTIIPDLFAAGGNWQWDIEMEGENQNMGGPDAQMMSDLREMLGDALEGEVNCEYKGVKEVDGNEYLAIEVVIKIDSTNDMMEYMETAMGEAEMPDGVDISVNKMDMETQLEGKGMLLWDGAGGHVHSFKYEGDFNIQMDMDMSINAMGQEMENATYMEMSGDMKLNVTTSK